MVADLLTSRADDARSVVERFRALGSDHRDAVAVDAAVLALRAADELTAAAMEIIGRLAPHGGVERATGLPVDLLLTLGARRPQPEARALAEAAACLRTMPATAAAFARGELAWATVRAICGIVRRVDLADRAAVDRIVADHVTEEPDTLIGLIDDEVARLREDLVQAREDRQIASGFLSIQPRLDGQGGSLYGEADAEAFATICEAIDIASPPPIDGDEPSTRARQRLDGLVAICEQRLAGPMIAGRSRRPRPRFLVSFDLRDLSHEQGSTARILWRTRGRLGRLSAAATETLLCDADIEPILFEGGRPIAVGDVIADISAKARTALIGRDRGCRFPGCSMPAAWTDAHHIKGRGPRTASIDDLIRLCRRCHRRVHRHRWRITTHPDDIITFTHRGHTWTSQPRGRDPARE